MENSINTTQPVTLKEWQELVDMIGTNMVTKEDLKKEVNVLELKIEKVIEQKIEKVIEGNDKIVGLLTKTDTEQAAIKGTLKRHEEDITGLKGRVNILEQKPGVI